MTTIIHCLHIHDDRHINCQADPCIAGVLDESMAMRVSRQRAAENRERIIDAAGALFRENGFDGIGVADIMKAAQLTHGGFYGHFRSTEHLVAQASQRAMARAAMNWTNVTAGAPKNPYAAL